MAENKPAADRAADTKPTNLQAENARLRAENERLRGQLAAAGASTRAGTVPAAKPYLTEGERQDLITFGVTNDVHAGQRMNLHDAAKRYPDADLADATDDAKTAADRDRTEAVERTSVRGVDYVWPSVEPGKIDPAVAGTPGINGPSADAK
ncbi:hypothetical protein [Micromonospora globispora]|uniref:hypothetical protein n=1 Tax=Micromonospora globispora TaxID=1450148 RepID=UPI000F5DA625|nr:hypothetical protein [Micromonospora globispora]RQW83559.1 hypothetical protein DKL51_31530 [Micromonospora globispora]